MLNTTPRPKQHGIPRDPSTYRSWKRNNAIKWLGVKTKKFEHPPLERRVSKKGEIHYVRPKQEQTVQL